MNRFLAIDSATKWVHGVIHQGHRLLAESDRHTPPHGIPPQEFMAWVERSRKTPNLIKIEEHFFVLSVGKCIDWLNIAKDYAEELSDPVANFLSKLPEAKIIRNMREHEEEYLQGNGRKQSEFVKELPFGQNPKGIKVDGSSTIVINGVYLIGGRLNVRATIDAAMELLPLMPSPHDPTTDGLPFLRRT